MMQRILVPGNHSHKMIDLLVELHGEVEAIEGIMDSSLQRIDGILNGSSVKIDVGPQSKSNEGESLRHDFPRVLPPASDHFISAHCSFLYAIDCL
jgi:hypothetical protein